MPLQSTTYRNIRVSSGFEYGDRVQEGQNARICSLFSCLSLIKKCEYSPQDLYFQLLMAVVPVVVACRVIFE